MAMVQQSTNMVKLLPSPKPMQDQVMKSSLYISMPIFHDHHQDMKVHGNYEILLALSIHNLQ